MQECRSLCRFVLASLLLRPFFTHAVRVVELFRAGTDLPSLPNCTCLFSPTTFKGAGDYIYACPDHPELLRYIAVNAPAHPGSRATHLLLSTSLSATTTHSATKYNFWRPLKQPGKQPHTLLSTPSDTPGTVRARTSFFNEPLLYNLTGVPLDAPFRFSIVGGRHGPGHPPGHTGSLTLVLEQRQLTFIKQQGNTTLVLFQQTVPNASSTTTADVQLRLNPRNFSVHCNEDGALAIAAPLPHHVDFRHWEHTTRLHVNGGTITTRLDIVSLLQSNLDPLRPNNTQSPTSSYYPYPNDPMPAVLGVDGVTDEVAGFDHRSLFPLGEAQPKATWGVVDVTQAPFHADPTGKQDSTAALQFAVDFARWHYYIVHVPRGEYKVTATISGIATTRMLTTGVVPGNHPV